MTVDKLNTMRFPGFGKRIFFIGAGGARAGQYTDIGVGARLGVVLRLNIDKYTLTDQGKPTSVYTNPLTD